MEFRVDFAGVNAIRPNGMSSMSITFYRLVSHFFTSTWSLTHSLTPLDGVEMGVKWLEIYHWWCVTCFERRAGLGNYYDIKWSRYSDHRLIEDLRVDFSAWCHCRWYAECSAATTATNWFPSRACWGVKLKSDSEWGERKWNERWHGRAANRCGSANRRSIGDQLQLRGWKSLINQIFILLSGLVNYDIIIDT